MSYVCCVAIWRKARVMGETSTNSKLIPGVLTLPSFSPLVCSYVPIATCIEARVHRGSAVGGRQPLLVSAGLELVVSEHATRIIQACPLGCLALDGLLRVFDLPRR